MINLVYVELESKVSGTALYGRSCSFGIGVVGVLELNRVVVALLPLANAITDNGILVELRLIEDNNLRIGVYVGDILESLFARGLVNGKVNSQNTVVLSWRSQFIAAIDGNIDTVVHCIDFKRISHVVEAIRKSIRELVCIGVIGSVVISNLTGKLVGHFLSDLRVGNASPTSCLLLGISRSRGKNLLVDSGDAGLLGYSHGFSAQDGENRRCTSIRLTRVEIAGHNQVVAIAIRRIRGPSLTSGDARRGWILTLNGIRNCVENIVGSDSRSISRC